MKKILACGMLLLASSAFAAGVSDDQTQNGGAIPVRIVSGGGGTGTTTLTQTRPTFAAGTSTTLIVANASRKSLEWQNTGANPMTCVPGAGPAVAGIGKNYPADPNAQGAGGGWSSSGVPVPLNAFTCISTAGTTATVWEGN